MQVLFRHDVGRANFIIESILKFLWPKSEAFMLVLCSIYLLSMLYLNKRPLDSYACPQQIFVAGKRYAKLGQFYGKMHCICKLFTFLAQKALFIPHLNTLKIARIEVKYTLCSAQGIKLSCEVPFVKFQWLVLELPADNQRVSNSVFFVSSYMPVLRSRTVFPPDQVRFYFMHSKKCKQTLQIQLTYACRAELLLPRFLPRLHEL